MNEKQIENIVSTVLSQLGESVDVKNIKTIDSGQNSTSTPLAKSTEKKSIQSDGELADLANDSVKKWNGVKNAVNKKVVDDLISQTDARINKGRAGPRPRTLALLRFLADHSKSKDSVLKNIDSSWLKEKGLMEVQSKAADKDEYLTRPDLGRKLSDNAKEQIKANCTNSPQVQIVLSDGLSLDAITRNYEEIFPPLMNGLKSAGFNVGTPFFLRYGRVKAQDEIGKLLNAEVNILLIGERPGLGQSESLSCYAIYKPNENTVESDRTVISNIHEGGTPPIEAAAVIVDLVKTMLAQKASGINLKR